MKVATLQFLKCYFPLLNDPVRCVDECENKFNSFKFQAHQATTFEHCALGEGGAWMFFQGTVDLYKISGLPLPRHISARWQPLSPGSLQNSTTSRHDVSGVMGTSVSACSPSLRYTVRIIWKRERDRVRSCVYMSVHLSIYGGYT